ncbi:MAG: hypothetical protein WCT03_20100 [Candidatus Obscuribacterales bacterium]|jgi:hypothetical protein
MSKTTVQILTAQQCLELESAPPPEEFEIIDHGLFDDILPCFIWIISRFGTRGGSNALPYRLNQGQRELLIKYMARRGWEMTYIEIDTFFTFLGIVKDRVHLKMITPPPSKFD